MDDSPKKDDSPRVVRVLEALKQASHELQAHPSPRSGKFNSPAIKALLELEVESDKILSSDPNLLTLAQHLGNLKALVETLQKCRGYGLRSFLTRRFATNSVSQVAGLIEAEIQAWIDRESLESLVRGLKEPSDDENELIKLLVQFENRLAQGFNRELQDLMLKSKVFSLLESIVCDSNFSKTIREHSAYAIGAMVRFNKDVFVGQEIESNGDIPKIISLLNCHDLQIRVLAMDCIIEIGYYGRKETVDTMLEEDLIDRLVELQRSELGGDLIGLGKHTAEESREVAAGEVEGRRESREKRFLESHPFASCVAKFAVQLEVGEGLRKREKRAIKPEILRRVRKACVSDAEAATIIAEVLWGSSP
ncbi:hypothetical protein SDJN02_14512, partial [Cucurbita argyrosperma subsp. argyrosperma]